MIVTPVAMLTHHDVTVPNALDVFEQNKHTKVQYWGFKNTGVDFKQSEKLAQAMRDAGKIVAYESLVSSEEDTLTAARFAIENGCKLFLGQDFHRSASDLLNEHDVWYFPSFGKRDGPSKLRGTPEEIVADGLAALSQGAYGLRLSVYRYMDGDPETMAAYVIPRVQDKGQMMITGTINSFERLDFLKNAQPWGFTMGGALFDDSFSGKDIAAKLDMIYDYMAK